MCIGSTLQGALAPMLSLEPACRVAAAACLIGTTDWPSRQAGRQAGRQPACLPALGAGLTRRLMSSSLRSLAARKAGHRVHSSCSTHPSAQMSAGRQAGRWLLVVGAMSVQRSLAFKADLWLPGHSAFAANAPSWATHQQCSAALAHLRSRSRAAPATSQVPCSGGCPPAAGCSACRWWL